MKNGVPNGCFNMLNNVNGCEENSETEGICGKSRNINASAQFDENLGFLVNKADSSLSCTESNGNVSEKKEVNSCNKNEKNVAVHNGIRNRTTDRIGGFDANSAIPGKELENSQCPNYEAKKMPPMTLDSSRKMKHHAIESKIKETSKKMKLDNSNNNDKIIMSFKAESPNKEKMTKSEQKINVVSKSDMVKNSKPLNGMISENDNEECKRNGVGNINNIKKCNLCLKSSENDNERGEVDIETVNRSVIDLIAYFESLTPKKHSDVRSKVKLFESKQGLKKDSIIKVDRIIKPNATVSLSAQTSLGISPKIDDAKRAVFEQPHTILSDNQADDRKKTIDAVPENLSCDLNSDDRKEFIDAPSKSNLPDLNTRVRERSLQKNSDTSPHDLDLSTRKIQNMLSPKAKVKKCVNFNHAANRSDSNVNTIKEHVFVFSDDPITELKRPKEAYSRRGRSRFTHTHINPIYERQKNNESTSLNLISWKTNECRNILPSSENQTDVRISLTDDSVNRSSFTENSMKVQKQNESSISKRKNDKSSENGCNVKRLVGFLLAAIIFVTIYEGVSNNYKLFII